MGVASLLLIAACGSSATEEPSSQTEAPGTDGAADTTLPQDSAATTTEAAAEPSADGGSATLTLSDGTVFTLDLSECITHDTDAITVPLIGGYTLEGEDADGHDFSIARLGLTKDEVAVQAGSLETDTGSSDTDILYSVRSATMDVAVDGGSVVGTFTMGAIGPTRPFGDEVDATLDATC